MNYEGIKVKGIVRLVLTDIETGKIVSDQTHQNIITEQGYGQIYNQGLIGNTIGISSQNTTPDPLVPGITNLYGFGYLRTGITSPTYTETDGTNPSYGEWQGRFDPPASVTRNIYTIFLSNNSSTNANAYLTLVSPCTQTSTQVLDIFYRVQFSGNYSEGVSTFGVDGLGRAVTLGDNTGVPSNPTSFLWNGNPHQGYWNVQGATNFGAVNGSVIDGAQDYWDNSSNFYTLNFSGEVNNQLLYKKKFTWSVDRSHANKFYPAVGRIFGTANIPTSGTFGFPDNSTRNSVARIAIRPSSYTKLQPVMYHSPTATLPFQDVNNLAVGAGTITLSGDWNNSTKWPEFYRLKILNTGDTGVATYNVIKRQFLGFNDNSYTDRPTVDPFFFTNVLNTESHGLGNSATTAIYSDTATVSWDNTGINLLDHVSGVITTWDGASTNVLTVTSINQVAPSKVDGTGLIWVASKTEGLFYIDPSSGVVTKMTFTEGFINEDVCMGVYRGMSQTMWALVSGAIVHIAADASSYTVYAPSTTPSFIQAGITDANWGTITYLKANPDANSPVNEILLVQNTNQLYWFNPATGVTTAGPQLGGGIGDHPTTLSGSPSAVGISETGGLWMATNGNASGYLTAFTNSFTQVNMGGSNMVNGADSFIYDVVGNPYAVVQISSTTVVSPKSNVNLPLDLVSNNLGVGAGTFSYIFPGTTITQGCSNFLQAISQQIPVGSHLRELIWKEFGWTGSAWQKDYFGTPVASPAGYLTISRRNFSDTSWTFNGSNTALVARNVGPYATRSNIKSILFTVNSQQIEDGNNKCVFEFNGAARFSILWIDSANPGKITLMDRNLTKTVLGTRPTDSNDHRIAMSISEGGQIIVWLDGVLLKGLNPPNIYPNVDFLNLNFGSTSDLENINTKYAGLIKNIVLLSENIGQAEVNLDYTQITTQTYGIYSTNNTRPIDQYFYYTNSQFTDSGTYAFTPNNNGATHSIVYSKTVLPTDDWEIDYTLTLATGTGGGQNWQIGIVAQGQNLSSGNTNYLRYGLEMPTNGTAMFPVAAGVVSSTSLGTYTGTDQFKIAKTGTTITYYQNGSAIHTDTYANTSTNNSMVVFADQGAHGTITVGSFVVNAAYSSAIAIGHWPLNDTITVTGQKATGTVSALIDGSSMAFADTVDASVNWSANDNFTWAGVDGFLKDNIRTLYGDYSIYYKPTQFGLTSVIPANVTSAPNGPVETQTQGLWAAATGLTSNGISVMGDSVNNTGAYNPTHFMIEFDDLNYLSITLNGVQATNKWIDANGMLPLTPYATGTNNVATISTRSVPFTINNTGTVVWIQLDDDSWFEATITGSPSANGITFTPGIPTGRTTKPYGRIVRPAVINAGECSIDPVFGIVRFNAADGSKAIVANYADIFT